MIRVHDLTPDIFYQRNLLSTQKATMISDYCQVSGIDFAFDEDSYLCEVELPKMWNKTIKNLELNLLDYIDWNYLSKNPSKKLILTHRIIYNLQDYLEKLNEISLKHNLTERLFWYTFNPLDFKFKDKCRFKLIFLNSITNVFYEGWIYKIFMCNRDSQELYEFQKYRYGFEPKDSNFEKLDVSRCDKYFMSSNRQEKAHRLLSTYLIDKNIESDKGILTYHGVEDVHLDMHTYLKNYQSILNDQGVNLKDLLNFRSFRRIPENENLYPKNHWYQSLRSTYINLFERCLVTYVNESTSNENEIFVTEKTWLSYAHGKPFILNANKNMLTWLEKYYGFKSFPMLFDESYDNRDNFVDRVCYGVDELTKFCSLSFEDARERVKSVQKILDHNYNVFYSLNHKENFLRIFDGI